MTLHEAPSMYPRIISHARWCRNGQVPTAAYMHACAQGLLHVAGFRKKMLFNYSRDWSSVPLGSAGTNSLWRFACRTGWGTDGIHFLMGLVVSDNASATDPRVNWSCTEVGVGTTTTSDLHCPGIDTSSTTTSYGGPDGVLWVGTELAATAGAEYRCTLQLIDYARVIAGAAWESPHRYLNDTATGIANPAYAVGNPILAADHDDLHVNGTRLLRQNAAQLLSWSADSTAPTVTGSTWTNLMDGTTAGVTASSVGSNIETTYHNTVSATTVPVELKIYAAHTSGPGTGEVRISDSSGALITITGITTAGWYSATGNVPAGNTKIDIEARGSGGPDVVAVSAVSLYEWSTWV